MTLLQYSPHNLKIFSALLLFLDISFDFIFSPASPHHTNPW